MLSIDGMYTLLQIFQLYIFHYMRKVWIFVFHFFYHVAHVTLMKFCPHSSAICTAGYPNLLSHISMAFSGRHQMLFSVLVIFKVINYKNRIWSKDVTLDLAMMWIFCKITWLIKIHFHLPAFQ